MPVFTRVRNGVLVVTVDGDYTSGELHRAGARGLDADDVQHPVPVLLDLSGAAGFEKKPSAELQATREFFVERQEQMTRVGALASSDIAFRIMERWCFFATTAGLEARPFRNRAEALEWLSPGVPE